MKYLSLFLLASIASGCGPNEAEVIEQQRIQDSLSVARTDSINKEKLIEELMAKYADVDSAKNAIQIDFDAVMVRLDSLTEEGDELERKFGNRFSEISKIKKEIGGIMENKTLTPAESKTVKSLIKKLNGKVADLIVAVKRSGS